MGNIIDTRADYMPPIGPQYQLNKRLRYCLGTAILCLFLAVVAYNLTNLVLIYRPHHAEPPEPDAPLPIALGRPSGPPPSLSLDDIVAGRYEPKRFAGHWTDGGELLYRDTGDGHLKLFTPDSGAGRLLVGADRVPALRTSFTQQLSPDGRFVMLEHRVVQSGEFTRLSWYTVYKLVARGGAEFVFNVTAVVDEPVDYARFGRHGTGVLFVQHNSIYLWDGDDHPPSMDHIRRLHRAAERPPHRFVGVPDRMYELDILRQSHTLWPSPDGALLAFLDLKMPSDSSTAQKLVRRHWLPGADGAALTNRTTPLWLTQSLVGQGVPLPTVYVHNVEPTDEDESAEWAETGGANSSAQADEPTSSTRSMVDKYHTFAVPLLPAQQRALQQGHNPILSAVHWVDTRTLLLTWLNRNQSAAHVQQCQWSRSRFSSVRCDRLVQRYESYAGWLTVQPIHYDPVARQLAVVRSAADDFSDWEQQHVVLLQPDRSGLRPLVLTSDALFVERILLWDHRSEYLFHLATRRGHGEELHLYATSTRRNHNHTACISCEFTMSGVTRQPLTTAEQHLHFNAHFAAERQLFVLEAEGPAVPEHAIFAWSVAPGDKQEERIRVHRVRQLETNDDLWRRWMRPELHHQHQPQLRFVRLPAVNGRGEIGVRLLLPPPLVQQEKMRTGGQLPLLVSVEQRSPGDYAGAARFRIDWQWWLAAGGIVVAQIDGAGSGRHDSANLHAVYGRTPGAQEAADVAQIIDWLASGEAREQLEGGMVNGSLVGMWGRGGFGGYVAALVLAQRSWKHLGGRRGPDAVRCAALQAPTVDWLNGGRAFFVERFMSTPIKESGGNVRQVYVDSNLAQMVREFDGRRVLLVQPRWHERFEHAQALGLEVAMRRSGGVELETVRWPDESEWRLAERRPVARRVAEFFRRCLVADCNYGL